MNLVKDMLMVVLAVVAVVAVVVLFKQHYVVSKKPVEGKEGFDPESKEVQPSYEDVSQNVVPQQVPQSAASKSGSDDRLVSSDLLPSGSIETNWSSIVQVPKADDMVTNYLAAGEHVGIVSPNSVLKNASLDIRPEPQIVKSKVSPW
jgi:hypothetical protein